MSMTDDFARRARSAAARLGPRWEPEEVEVQLTRLHRGLSRRQAARIGLGAVGAAALLALVSVSRTEAPKLAVPFRLGDGTLVTPLGERSDLAAAEVTPSRVTVRLAAGGARFDVPRNPAREFRVEAGPVRVVVLGTEFQVARQDNHAQVVVLRGRVRIEWPGGASTLSAGQQATFPPPSPLPLLPEGEGPPASAVEPPPPPPGIAADATPASGRRRASPAAAAPAATEPPPLAAPPAPLPDEVNDLLEAADQARIRGDIPAAVAHLRRALAVTPHDRGNAVIAFTLGRLLLEKGADATGAAEAFALAGAAAPDGPLVEDALAREVEAWAGAANILRARERALEYVERYPHGRRLRAVRRYGGLE